MRALVSVKSNLADTDRLGIEPKLRCFDITAVADHHIEQSLTVILALDTIRVAGKAVFATIACIDKNSHVRVLRKERAIKLGIAHHLGEQKNRYKLSQR